MLGEYEGTASDGDAHNFSVGDVLLLEDTWGKGHSTRITTEHDGPIFAVLLADK